MTKRRMGGGSGRASAVTCGGKRGERELPLNYAGLFSVPKTNQPDGEGQGPPSPPLSRHCTSARCIKRSVRTLPQGSGLPPLPRCGLRLLEAGLNKSVSPPTIINIFSARECVFSFTEGKRF